ncbi:bacterio-opsin activator domain-containing protein [Natrialba sp. SSL1]|uniref:bacterio-opsin activator domain-containing protein n=1 Tax=Natrialba sp. SSL1 TaxID=1869245 RepID=UPI0008F7F383|nr:bacterio-opsin activator domain-containing protein [Natrialba sp. SSL1]OIB57561.1 response regulator receiver protein [Natrialba sp. SSL1]
MNSTTPTRRAPDSPEPIRVLFVDTDERTARAATAVFDAEFGIHAQVASSTDDDAFAERLEVIDCVVTGHSPSTSSDRSPLRAVRAVDSDLPVVVFSTVRDEERIEHALSAGATDFVRIDADDAGYWTLGARISALVGSERVDEDTARAGRPSDTALVGSSVLDESLTFTAVSASHAALHDKRRASLVGHSWTGVFPDDETTVLESVAQRARTRGSAVGSVTALRSAQRFPALVSLVRVRAAFVCTVFDQSWREGGRGMGEERREGEEGEGDGDGDGDRVREQTVRPTDGEVGRTTHGIERALLGIESLANTRVGPDESGTREFCETIVDTVESGSRPGRGQSVTATTATTTVAAVYCYDEESDALRRQATTRAGEFDRTVSLVAQTLPLSRAFLDREPVFVAGLQRGTPTTVTDPRRACGLVTPIGSHGVLIAGVHESAAQRRSQSTSGPDGDETPRLTALDRAFVRLVGATAGTVLDRVAAKRDLDACETDLDAATESVDSLTETIELVCAVARAISTAWTRGELETRVCDSLIASERYTVARIAALDSAGETVTVRDRAWAGAQQELESPDASVDALVDEGEPMASTLRTLEPCTHRRLLSDPGAIDQHWRQTAVSQGIRAVLAVPLVFRERSYGGLAVYSEQPTAFDTDERRLIADLGMWVAQASNAIETRTALVGHSEVELEFRLRGPDIELLEWARETGGTVEFETAVSRPDGSIRGFFTVENATEETILELAARSPSVSDAQLVTTHGDRQLFECTLTEETLVARLLEYGVVPRRISAGEEASEEAGRLVVSLPAQTDVREFVEFVSRLYPDSTLVRRREREGDARPGYGFRAELESVLTARQHEALETAFVSGYFDIPRETSGAAVAEMLEITQPTFNTHLRVAERKLLELVFARDEGSDEERAGR